MQPGHLDGRARRVDDLDANRLVGQAGEAAAANVCDPNCTMVAKVAKSYVGVAPYGGVHARLCAAEYVSHR